MTHLDVLGGGELAEHRLPSAQVRCWKVVDWPALDQALWAAAIAPVKRFARVTVLPQLAAPATNPGGRSYGNRVARRHNAPRGGSRSRNPDTLEKWRKGYGRWLHFLDQMGWLDPAAPPLARVTKERLGAYAEALGAAGNADYTMIGRFAELEAALAMMCPGQATGWIRRPFGVSVYASLPKSRRPKNVPDSSVLRDWGVEMMDSVDFAQAGKEEYLRFRNGLLIALFARRGRRLRAMAGLRVGQEVIRRDDIYWIDLPADLVKTRQPDAFPLPADLTIYVQRYLDAVRPRLLGNGFCEAFWIGAQGSPWTAKGIQFCIFALTAARFGMGFGPHRFRHALATTLTLRAPDRPGLAAGALGITEAVVEQSYLLTGQVEATNTLNEILEQKRINNRTLYKL